VRQLQQEDDGEVSFINRGNFDVGDGPGSVAVGEFNGDGFSDLAVVNRGDDNVSVLLGRGDGGFSSATILGTGRKCVFLLFRKILFLSVSRECES